jgi:hypothetical protein
MKVKKPRSMKKSAKLKKNPTRVSKATLMIILGVIAAISVVVISLAGGGSSKGVAEAANPQKRYKASRPIVVDQQTGELRMPTRQEVAEVMQSLETLAKRPTQGLQQTVVVNGGVASDLGGGYGGVVLARPTADGSWETKCVFTVEEGAAFLGLVEDNSQQ